MKLYDYHRSSASYRVRIALNLKGLEYEKIPVNLLEKEQLAAGYTRINPNNSVPTLQDGELNIYQSLAILEYLEEKYPEFAILPEENKGRAVVRSIAQIITSDIHTLNNMRVLNYLKDELGISEDQKIAWYHYWIRRGFAAVEAILKRTAGQYCFGNKVTMADICLIPQTYNAHRFECDISEFTKINEIYNQCCKLEAFAKASPQE